MDKYLLLLGFQLTQVVALGALDGSVWRTVAGRSWQDLLAGVLDPANLGVLLQVMLSGTWIGRLGEIGEFGALLVHGAGRLPLALILLQWLVLLGLLRAERVILHRRLRRIESGS